MGCFAAIALSVHAFAGDYNSVHPSVRCSVENWSIGAFYNSERKVSITAGYTFDLGTFWIEGGLATGYLYADVIPFVRAGVPISDKTNLFILPTLKPGGNNLGLVFGVERRF